MVDGLDPPTLRDDRGVVYEPVERRPSSSSGTGGMSRDDHQPVVTGVWLYTPTAGDDAATFTVERAGGRWVLS